MQFMDAACHSSLLALTVNLAIHLFKVQGTFKLQNNNMAAAETLMIKLQNVSPKLAGNIMATSMFFPVYGPNGTHNSQYMFFINRKRSFYNRKYSKMYVWS